MFWRFGNTVLTVLVVLLLFSCNSKLVAQSESNIIYIPAHLDKEVTESVNDMAYWLEAASGKKFQVREGGSAADKGIHLIPVEKSELPNRVRADIQKDGQSFHLLVDGLSNVQITGTGKNSFINGIYTFLQESGFRWYMPGDLWVKMGDLKKLPSINKTYTPDFPNRFYAGSGGAHPIPVIDPQDNFSKEIILWNRRNRVSVDYTNKGHSGMNFYTNKKEELDKHPEYFCNNKVTRYTRLNIDNKNAVNLFVDWALEQVKPGLAFPVIGLDPADGAGGAEDCLPASIPSVKTWSDKYFWLANQVAKKLPESDKKTHVQLYAYNNHAAPPNFSLDDNVYPVIIPYAFQNVSEPEEFITLWSKTMKGKPMGIYDYWNITQWSKCLPQFNIYVIEPRLRLWKKNNINSVQLESTYAKGPMGHAFWIAMQMMWDTQLSFDDLYNEFLTDCFGKAAPDIKKMYDRWSTNYQGSMEAPLSDHDLAAAVTSVKDKNTLQRINELKAYVHYIKLYENYSANMTVPGYNDLIHYIYGIHHMGMLHTSALQSLYIPKPKDYKPVTDKKIIEENNKKIKILQAADVENIFQNDLKAAPPVYAFSKVIFDIKKAKPVAVKKSWNPLYINNVNNYSFFLDKGKEFSIQAGSSKDTRFVIRDNNNKTWLADTIKASREGYTTMKVKLPAGEYTITFGETLRFSRMIFPTDIAFFTSERGYDNAGYPWQYIYIPSDVKEVVYNDNLGAGLGGRGFWQNPDGQKVQPVKIAEKVYKVEIPQQYRGKVWVLNIGHRQFKMLNIPDVYSLNLFEYHE